MSDELGRHYAKITTDEQCHRCGANAKGGTAIEDEFFCAPCYEHLSEAGIAMHEAERDLA